MFSPKSKVANVTNQSIDPFPAENPQGKFVVYVSEEELNSSKKQTALIATGEFAKAEQEVLGITANVTYTNAKGYLLNGSSDTTVSIKSLKSKNSDGIIESQNQVSINFKRVGSNILPDSIAFVYTDLDEQNIRTRSTALITAVTGDTDSTYLGKKVEIEKILNSDKRQIIKLIIQSNYYCVASGCYNGICCCNC